MLFLVMGGTGELYFLHLRVFSSTLEQISALESEKQALLRRCTDAEDAASRRRRQAEEARDRLQEMLEEVSMLKEACAGKNRIALEVRAEAKHASDRLAAEWGREKAEFKATIEALTKRLVSHFYYTRLR